MSVSQSQFESLLDEVADQLRSEASSEKFQSAQEFESRVREITHEKLVQYELEVDFEPHPHGFPDIAVDEFGIEVKFTTNDTWRSVANSVLETNRVEGVQKIYLMFGKMGGTPDVKWNKYEDCVMHVRTSHVPRFEVEIDTASPLFEMMRVGYNQFRILPMHEKMEHIRQYARGRLKEGERLWWLEDEESEDSHTLPIQARLYTKLSQEEKLKYRAEAVLLCPQIVSSGRSRNKYDDVVLYLLTYHGILCHQARDLFSAGSVANPKNDDEGGIYIERAIKLIEPQILNAANYMKDVLFEEYWGKVVPVNKRIDAWLKLADGYAKDWKPSVSLFKSE